MNKNQFEHVEQFLADGQLTNEKSYSSTRLAFRSYPTGFHSSKSFVYIRARLCASDSKACWMMAAPAEKRAPHRARFLSFLIAERKESK